MTDGKRGSPSVYLAAERTFLAWIRTGIALMGFGFVVARFGLFLRELATSSHGNPPESGGLSIWIGTTLLLLGATVNVIATLHHVRLIGRLRRGEEIDQPSTAAISLALILATLALTLAIYVILIG